MKIAPGLLIALSMLVGQNANDTPEAHVAIAKTAAGDDYRNLFNFLCTVPVARGGGGPGGAPGGGQRQGPPDRSTWYAEPVKVFDNLYFLGQTEYSVWAVTTSAGIIAIDTIFDYSVEEEVAGGLKKLGLDPATIKCAVVTHAHPDHHGGARFLQERYGSRVLMSPADWDFLDRASGAKPKRDMVATDGQKLTLGDTTLTLYLTPGHTPGTLSLLIPVKDNGKPHLAALWGGTGLNADRDSLQTYIPRRSGSTTLRGRPVRTSSFRTTPTGTDRRSTCRCWRSARPLVKAVPIHTTTRTSLATKASGGI
jgi:metallo-beta-lactamase class B